MKKYIATIGVSSLIMMIVIMDLLMPVKVYSAFENRYLTTRPPLSFFSVVSNKYSLTYEEYVNDQFFKRDSWITLKAWVEMMLQKSESNGVYIGYDGFLFEKVIHQDEQLAINKQAIEEFLEKVNNQNVSIALSMSSYMTLKQNMPKHAPYFDQNQWLNDNTKNWPMIDLYDPTLDYSSLVYRNDHHWTLEGAHVAYQKIVEQWGEKSIPFEDFNATSINHFLGSTFNKARIINPTPDVFSYIDPAIDAYVFDNKQTDSLINQSMLHQKDKYAAFMHGNIGFSKVIVSQVEKPSKILVIKDSYANSVIPFLINHHDEIDVVDLRNYNGSVLELIKENNYDQVLVLMSFSQFSTDKSISKLNH